MRVMILFTVIFQVTLRIKSFSSQSSEDEPIFLLLLIRTLIFNVIFFNRLSPLPFLVQVTPYLLPYRFPPDRGIFYGFRLHNKTKV
jgi:hypothetical protein